MKSKMKRLKREMLELEQYESKILEAIAQEYLPEEELKQAVQDLFIISEVILRAGNVLRESKKKK